MGLVGSVTSAKFVWLIRSHDGWSVRYRLCVVVDGVMSGVVDGMVGGVVAGVVGGAVVGVV